MLMVLLFFAAWGFDVFVLVPRQKEGVPSKGMSRMIPLKALFLISLIIFGLAWLVPQSVSLRFFSLIFFALLGFYLLRRLEIEHHACRRIRVSDSASARRDVFFLFTGILLKWFWGTLVLYVILKGAGLVFPLLVEEELGVSAIFSFLAGLWMIVLILRFQRKAPMYSVNMLLGLTQGQRQISWIWPVLSGLAVALAAGFLLVNYFYQAVTPFSEMMDWAEPSWVFVVFLMIAVLTAPFLEEAIFRGFFFRVLEDSRGRSFAFWIVGASFGLLHMDQYWGNWAGIGIVVLLGFLLTWFRMVSGSARPAMILHYTFNMMMVVVPVFFFVLSRPVFAEYYLRQSELSFLQKEGMLHESLKEDPQNAAAYHEFALLYLKHQASLEQALDYAGRALELMPERTIFHFTQAKILHALGRTDDAAVILRALRDQMPGNRDIEQMLKDL